MKPVVALVVALVLVASGCASSVTETVAADIASEPDVALVATGRAALAEAQGSPHVLWFWGAH